MGRAVRPILWLGSWSCRRIFVRSVDLQQSPERPGQAGGYRIILYGPRLVRVVHHPRCTPRGRPNALPRWREEPWTFVSKPVANV